MKKRTGTSALKKASREFSVLVERDEDGWYVATVPELRGATRRRVRLAL